MCNTVEWNPTYFIDIFSDDYHPTWSKIFFININDIVLNLFIPLYYEWVFTPQDTLCYFLGAFRKTSFMES